MNDIDIAKEREKFEVAVPAIISSRLVHFGTWLAAKRQAREELLAILPEKRKAPRDSLGREQEWARVWNDYRAELLRRMGQ